MARKQKENTDTVSTLRIAWRDVSAEARGRSGIIAVLIIIGALGWGLGILR